MAAVCAPSCGAEVLQTRHRASLRRRWTLARLGSREYLIGLIAAEVASTGTGGSAAASRGRGVS